MVADVILAVAIVQNGAEVDLLHEDVFCVLCELIGVKKKLAKQAFLLGPAIFQTANLLLFFIH